MVLPSSSSLSTSSNTQPVLFENHGMESLVKASLTSKDFFNPLFDARVAIINTLLPNDDKNFTCKGEDDLLQSIAGLLSDLAKYIQKDNPEQILRICQQLCSYIYNYINYRANGIQHHLNTRGVNELYPATSQAPMVIHAHRELGEYSIKVTFNEHKKRQKTELAKYFQLPVFQKLNQRLRQIAPALFYQAETLPSLGNAFSNIGMQFFVPPYLAELNKILYIIHEILQKKTDLTAASMQLKQLTPQLKLNLTRVHIIELLCKVYTPLEFLAYVQPMDLALCQDSLYLFLSIGRYFPLNIIHPNLLEISDTTIKQSLKILQSPTASDDEKGSAGRKVMFAAIPWRYIIPLGALIKSQPTVLFEASKELNSSWQSLLPALQNILSYEVSLAQNNANFPSLKYNPIPEKDYIFLSYIGNYANDILFLNKIISVLAELDFSIPFPAATHLRLLAILGECAKNMSPILKHMINPRYWKILSKIRDGILHSIGKANRIFKVLTDDMQLVTILQQDLQQLLTSAQGTLTLLPTTWEEVKIFYAQDISCIKSGAEHLTDGMQQLLDSLDPIFKAADFRELRETKHAAPVNQKSNSQQVLRILNGTTEIKSIDQKDFEQLVSSLVKINKNKKKKIIESFKRLKKNQPARLSADLVEDLNNITDISLTEIEKNIATLIKEFRFLCPSGAIA